MILFPKSFSFPSFSRVFSLVFVSLLRWRLMFPKAAVPQPRSPSRRPPQPRTPRPGGTGTGHHFVLEQLCPWASPGQRLPITFNTPSSVRSGSCQGKHCAGVLLPPCFCLWLLFFLMFLMILQRSPNDGDGRAARGSPRAAPAAAPPPGTVTPGDHHPWGPSPLGTSPPGAGNGDRDSPAAPTTGQPWGGCWPLGMRCRLSPRYQSQPG